MFGPPGIAYVYFPYGMHHCLNAVTGEGGDASAVLIRALEPVFNVDAMRAGAPTLLDDHLVASGPGRLCRSLEIDCRLNGSSLLTGDVRILPCDLMDESVSRGIRVGLSIDDERPWRFWLDSSSVSRFSTRRPGRRR